MKRLSIALMLIPVIALGSDSDSDKLSWLAGCWMTPDKSSQEVWVIDSDRSLAGFSVAISSNKVGFYEVLSISRGKDGSWVYTAYPSGQASASFTATEITENSVVFANPDHDYPQEIRYVREGNRLFATISLLGGVDPNSFDKVACE